MKTDKSHYYEDEKVCFSGTAPKPGQLDVVFTEDTFGNVYTVNGIVPQPNGDFKNGTLADNFYVGGGKYTLTAEQDSWTDPDPVDITVGDKPSQTKKFTMQRNGNILDIDGCVKDQGPVLGVVKYPNGKIERSAWNAGLGGHLHEEILMNDKGTYLIRAEQRMIRIEGKYEYQ